MNGNKFATGQILRKPVEVVKGRILACWGQKSPEAWIEKQAAHRRLGQAPPNPQQEDTVGL